MRLVTFLDHRIERLGALISNDEQIVDLATGARAISGRAPMSLSSMLALILGGEASLKLAREIVATRPPAALRSTQEVKLLAPLPRPVCIRDFVGFPAHHDRGLKQGGAETPGAGGAAPSGGELVRIKPCYYNVNVKLISGPGDDIVMPAFTERLDLELEYAAVIGKQGKDIRLAEARDYIFGYTIFNDWSARDMQFQFLNTLLGPGKGKDFDGSNTLGPCIVTADEIRNADNLSMVSRVNGEVWCRANSSVRAHRFEDMIVEASRSETLLPGELLASGTPPGGCGLEIGRKINVGDVVELEVEGIGILRNRVVAG